MSPVFLACFRIWCDDSFRFMERKAIIVEDELTWATAIASELKRFGIESEVTNDPITAEKLLEDTEFKVLVADLNLGDSASTTSMFDVVSKLKRTDVLVIILSSFTNAYDRKLGSKTGGNIGGMIAKLGSKVWTQIHKDDILDTQANGKKAPLTLGLPKLRGLLTKLNILGEISKRCVYFRSADGRFEYRIHRNGTATGQWRGKELNHTVPRAALVKHIIVETMAGRSVPTQALLDKFSEAANENPDYLTSYDKVRKVFRDDPLDDGFFQQVSKSKYGEYKASPFI
jgi:hypothetical protein